MNSENVYYIANQGEREGQEEEEEGEECGYNVENMSLGEKDALLRNVEAQIEARRAMLLKKRRHLESASKENEFLNVVRDDYQKYYDYIIGQKQDQMKAMGLLKKYVDDLIVTGKMTDTDLQNAKQDQQELMGEVGKIKKGLDEIIR